MRLSHNPPLLLLLLLLAITAFHQLGECRRRNRIRDGSLVKENEIPSLVAFLENGKIAFTGNLVSQKTVLTAGHNLNAISNGASKDKYQVLVGAHDITGAYGSEHKYKIAGFKRFKDADVLEPPDDIALVFLDRQVELSKLGDRAKIGQLTSLEAEDVSNCIIAGWGLPARSSPAGSPVPKKASVQLIPTQQACGKAVEEKTGVPELMIAPKKYGYRAESLCFYGQNGNQCLGDSGGPVLCLHPDTLEIVQIGVISTTFSTGDGCGDKMSVASSSSAHHMWINQWLQH